MGYNAYQLDFDFSIPAQDMARGLGLLNAEEECCYDSIAAALEDLGFGVEVEDGGISQIWWEDGKYRSDIERSLSLIAPVVKSGSHLDFIGEDFDSWSLTFDGEAMHLKSGQIVFS